jgi:hypothetical protein
MKFRKRVTWTAEYETILEFEVDPAEYSEEEHGSFDEFVEAVTDDAVSDINIPETGDSSYVDCSFSVSLIENIPIPPLEHLAEAAE